MNPGGERPPAELRAGFEGILERVQNAARLIGGEVGAGAGFSGAPGELRVALGFPDTYEIGISNQALQILYHLARRVPGVGVERVYLPWVDVLQEQRRERIPLLTLETWTPIAHTHLLGLSLQHELNYTNVLEMLDVAGIPLRASARGEEHPLVVAGGPAVANFLPMAPFLDAVAVGDGEELFAEMLVLLRDGRAAGHSRPELKARLAELPGVFVPGISRRVRRRVLAHLTDADYPAACLVPLTAGVHDRAWVEVMRGCSRGCRFCQAGMWYRPVRERPVEDVLARAGSQLAATGHEEVTLASLSTTDYTGVEQALARLAHAHPEVKVGLPSLRVDTAAVRLGHLVSPTSSSITLAPEAGSQRLRDVINKNVSEDDLLAAVQEALLLGHTTIKLYFMIGLPGETDDDAAEIVALSGRVRALARQILGPRFGRFQLTVSVTNFIPKPFSPFQWAGMAGTETLRRRQKVLRDGLRRMNARLALHDVESSFLEAALARGGVEMAEVIEGAWRRGARFDSWTEHKRPEAWREALAAAGLEAEQLATRTLGRREPLPWDVISGVATRAYLWEEWQKGARGETTVDCRDGECGDCGACLGDLQVELAPGPGVDEAVSAGDSAALAAEPSSGAPSGAAMASGAQSPGAAAASAVGPEGLSAGSVPEPAVRLSYVLAFSVSGRLRFLGHLDTLEVLRRAVRRAGGRLARSGGLRPKPLLSLALPRGVGVAGRRELCELVLAEKPPATFEGRLAAALPEGLRLLELLPLPERPHLAGRVVGARYVVRAAAEENAAEPRVFAQAAAGYTKRESVPIERVRVGKRRQVDVRAYVDEIFVSGGPQELVLEYAAAITPRGTVRPEEVVQALAEVAGLPLRMTGAERVDILLREA